MAAPGGDFLARQASMASTEFWGSRVYAFRAVGFEGVGFGGSGCRV